MPTGRAGRAIFAAFFAVGVALAPSLARADVTHVVARGHTLEAIAHRYHVTVQAIVDANHIKDPQHLKVGAVLTIPGVKATARGTVAAAVPSKGDLRGEKKPKTYAMRSKTPDVIHATRLATSESFTIRVRDNRGRVPPTAVRAFERMLRATNNQTHAIEPRLVALARVVSNHFGGRKLEIISGFRPYKTTQYTKHSKHNIGHAMDFRVVGVPNEVLRDFCRTLKNTGCGYYPNSTFVHMDARESSAFWIDYARPGEPPRYAGAGGEADEGTSDVGDDAHVPPPAPPDGGGDDVIPAGASPLDPAPAPSAAPSGSAAPPSANPPPAPSAGGSVATPASSPMPAAAPPTASPSATPSR